MEKQTVVNIIAIAWALAAFLLPLIKFGALPDGGDADALAQTYGILTVLPPLLALVLAFLTKNVILSLFLGVLDGAWMIALVSGNIINAIGDAFFNSTDYFVGTLADRWDAGIIMQVLVIGALIALITRMGGMAGIAQFIAKVAKGPRSAQIAMWLSSWVIFFDDYANALIIGPIMRPACDKFRISREKLAYIVDSTAAPVAGIMLISTWIGTELVNIGQGLQNAAVEGISSYTVFVDTIPFRFYNILTLFFVLMTAILLREYGPMFKAETRARTTGQSVNPGSEVMEEEEMGDEIEDNADLKKDHSVLRPSKKVHPPRIINAVIPILVLIVSGVILFYTNGANCIMAGDGMISAEEFASFGFFESIRDAYSNADASIVLFQAGLLACIVALIMGFAQRIFTIKDGIETWAHGMKSMLFVCIILILAWSIGSVIGDLGTASYLIGALSETLPMWIVPMLVFIIAAIVSFATGTAYGTMAILLPLVIPLATAIAGFSGGEMTTDMAAYGYMIIASSAVLTGAIFGDHCSPISDSTILSTMGAGCALMDHVTTQMTYAVTVAVAVCIGYILAGLGVNVWLTLLITAALLVGVLLVFGKKVPAWKGKSENVQAPAEPAEA
ncbi:MAG TPA: Na+/H+ antiporter NhaC family protein [Methanocorpusculum sp.]|nr:Na+/H+ antiporter NhaC family protein [Methanocorpusculum sp.]